MPPEDVAIETFHEQLRGSRAEIVNADGSGWEITLDVENRRKIACEIVGR